MRIYIRIECLVEEEVDLEIEVESENASGVERVREWETRHLCISIRSIVHDKTITAALAATSVCNLSSIPP